MSRNEADPDDTPSAQGTTEDAGGQEPADATPAESTSKDALLRGVSRRDLLLAGGMGGTLLLGGSVLARGLGNAASAESTAGDAAYADHGGGGQPSRGGHHGHVLEDLEDLGVVQAGYGHGPGPPGDLDAADGLALATPPTRDDAPAGTVREFDMPVTVQRHGVADGAAIEAWVYGGRLPGPVIRATEGDQLRLHFDNRTDLAHNLHFHGTHDPQMDGWEPIPGGESFTYEIEAGPAGLHPYHCHVPPYAEHIRRGLYGVMIVDPPGGREPAQEFVLVLGGFDLDGDGHNEVYGFNGVSGIYDRFPLRVEVGELVRVYVLNMVEGEAVASFHLHAQTFDVIRSGIGTSPHEHTDQILLGQADRAIVEFRLPKRGRYMFHPHQHHMVERGAMGWFTAV